MPVCTEGHEIITGTSTCQHGHTSGAESVNPSSENLMIQLMQQMISLQQENNALRRNTREPANSLAKKPDRPQIQHDANDSDWALFVDSWTRYKTMARLHNADEIRNELRAACSKEIDKLLFNFIGADVLNSSTEEELLNHIKSVAVRGLHKEVHRQTFQSICQKEGEPKTHFLAGL